MKTVLNEWQSDLSNTAELIAQRSRSRPFFALSFYFEHYDSSYVDYCLCNLIGRAEGLHSFALANYFCFSIGTAFEVT